MQYSSEFLVMSLRDADLRNAELEIERRRQAVERDRPGGEAPEASVTRRHRRPARAARLALR